MSSSAGSFGIQGKRVSAALLTLFLLANGMPAFAASGSVKCSDGKTYTATVSGGSCKQGSNWVQCTSGSGGSADINCTRMPDPCHSSGNGSGCKAELVVSPGGGGKSPRDLLRQNMLPGKPLTKTQ